MKVALCVQIKLENNYIREWIEYHKKLGFDRIFIYDNNDAQGEIIDDVIDDYIKSGYVIIDKSFMNIKFIQIESYNKCINTYKDEYDWICFIDLDEFIYIEDFDTIQEFLSSNKKFEKFDSIALQWVTYKDNGYIEVSSHSVLKNFDNQFNISEDYSMQSLFKTIVNCNSVKRYDDLFFGDAHKLANPDITICDTDGNYLHFLNATIQPNINHIYIKHFITKSLSEFINQKISRGIYWQKYENAEIYDLYKDINGWNNEYANYIDYRLNNVNRVKKILICVFTNNDYAISLVESTYLKTTKKYNNIDYKIILEDNSNFNIYYKTFKEIYDNGNIYDSIVCINQQTFLNIHLLNRFINILSDDNTIYTNILQIRLTNNDICERFFILSKKHIEQIINNDIYENKADCLTYFPYYTLSMILSTFDQNIFKSLGNIDIIFDNDYELNDRTESIISWTYNDLITNKNISKLTAEYNNLNDFINKNKFKFILRMPTIKLGHFNYYKELSDGSEECQFVGCI